MAQKKSCWPQDHVGSLIGVGTTIVGDIKFSGGLRIDGAVRGTIRASDRDGVLVVGERACVEGECSVSHAVINGTIVGPAITSEMVELQSGARLTCDVQYAEIRMHAGAVILGRLIPHGEAAKAEREGPAFDDGRIETTDALRAISGG